MALCTLEEVKQFIDRDKWDDTDEEIIEELIDRVQALFEAYCDRTFDSATYTEELSTNRSDMLMPTYYPITSISAIYSDSDWTFGVDTLIDSTSYKVYKSRYVVNKNGTFITGTANNKIVYTAGYVSIPNDLKEVCIAEIKARLNNGTVNEQGQFLPPNYETRAFLPETEVVLDKYRSYGSV